MLTKTKPKITSEVMTVTPELATKWLEKNTHNRPIAQGKIDTYAAAIRAEKWELNGETIIFDQDGVLQDGQHRLWGCIEANKAFHTLVVFGVDPATFTTIDTGKARNSKDVLGIAGHSYVAPLAAAAGIAIRYESNTLRLDHPLSNALVLAYVEKHPELAKWVRKAQEHKVTRAFGSSLAAVTYLASKRYGIKAEEFLRQFGTGENLPIGSPVLALRNRLFADRRLRKIERLGLIVLTWNAFVTGRSLAKTQMPRGTDFPKINGAD